MRNPFVYVAATVTVAVTSAFIAAPHFLDRGRDDAARKSIAEVTIAQALALIERGKVTSAEDLNAHIEPGVLIGVSQRGDMEYLVLAVSETGRAFTRVGTQGIRSFDTQWDAMWAAGERGFVDFTWTTTE